MYVRLSNLLVILLGLAKLPACSSATAAAIDYPTSRPLVHASSLLNGTEMTASIPTDFRIELELELTFRFPPEACFTNIIAALGSNALRDFNGKMPISNVRTTRFPEPVIKMTAPRVMELARRYMIWGLFLVAFYVHSHDACKMSFYNFQWKGVEVAGIGIAGTPSKGVAQSGTIGMPPSNPVIHLDFAFYGGSLELGKGAVFMTIITSLLEAAPQSASDRIYQPIINYLQNEPAAFIINPTERARSARSPYFTNEMLIDSLVRATDFYVENDIYRQLEMNISIDGVLVAQGAILQRNNLGLLGFSSALEGQERGIT